MREIKFRAWDKLTSELLEPKTIQWLMMSDLNERVKEDFELMQYTLLNDKNWKEIYFDDYVQTMFHIYKVKQSKFKISLVNISNWDIIDLSDVLLDNLTIIWNIYENKEEDIKKYCPI